MFHLTVIVKYEVYLKIQEVLEKLIVYLPSYDTSSTKNDACNNSSIVVCVIVAVVKLSPSR
jgi:hypothetical protein